MNVEVRKSSINNTAMIAVAGYMALLRRSVAKAMERQRQGFGGKAYLRKKKFKLEAQGNLKIKVENIFKIK